MSLTSRLAPRSRSSFAASFSIATIASINAVRLSCDGNRLRTTSDCRKARPKLQGIAWSSPAEGAAATSRVQPYCTPSPLHPVPDLAVGTQFGNPTQLTLLEASMSAPAASSSATKPVRPAATATISGVYPYCHREQQIRVKQTNATAGHRFARPDHCLRHWKGCMPPTCRRQAMLDTKPCPGNKHLWQGAPSATPAGHRLRSTIGYLVFGLQVGLVLQ